MLGMDDEWAGADWSEGREQAFRDAWAVRIRDCPLPRCRRAGHCVGLRAETGCLGMARHPIPKEESEARRVLAVKLLDRRRAEIRAGGPPPDRTEEAAADRRRGKLAAARAKRWLGVRGRSGKRG